MSNTNLADAPKACSRPVDLVHLARYTLGDRSLEREVLQLFKAQSDVYISRLEHAEGDPRGWHAAAHSIKGAARSIGAWKLADAAERAEGAAGESAGPCRKLLDEVRRLTLETNRYIDELFAAA